MQSKTILVVDNDAAFRNSLTGLLNRAGYRALDAADYRSAIRISASVEIDLLVADLALPDVTATALIEVISAGQTKTLKVIASTSLFTKTGLATRDTFEYHAEITKEAEGEAANAAKWLLAVRGLLGEHFHYAPEPSNSIILLADDDAAVRLLTRDIIKGVGYQVLEAVDGDSALALARRIGGNLDLVTDVEMPGMDGRALGRAIREAYSTVPVIYISGITEGPGTQNLHDPKQGFAFIQKPFEPKVLLETVARMLKQNPNVTVSPAN